MSGKKGSVKRRTIKPSVREDFLKSELFSSGKQFTRFDIYKIMPWAKVVDIQNLTSILKVEGVLSTVSRPGKSTIFYKTRPGYTPWLQRSWRSRTNKALGIKQTPF